MSSAETLNADSITEFDHSSGGPWTNPNDAIGDTGSAASFTKSVANSDWLAGITADSISIYATIVGFEVRFKHRYTPDASSSSSGELSIVKNGAVVGTAKSTGVWSETTAWSSVFGGPTDLWGTTGDGTDVWGVAVWCGGDKYDLFEVFAFELVIYYTDSSITITDEILRPIAGLEGDVGNTTWDSLNDVVTQPTSPGSSDYVAYSGTSAGSVTEKFQVEAPTPGYTIIAAKLWVLGSADIASTMKISSIRLKINGTWYDLGGQVDIFTTSPTWYSYEVLGVLNESSSSSDIGFEWTITELFGTPGQSSRLDVAYMELTYLDPSSPVGGFFLWW